jgi:hypothetical protein
MMNPVDYEILYSDLLSKNYILINDPVQYGNGHYLPDSLKYIENYTPKPYSKKLKTRKVSLS